MGDILRPMSAAVEAYDCLIVSLSWCHSTLLRNKKGNNFKITVRPDKVRAESVPAGGAEG